MYRIKNILPLLIFFCFNTLPGQEFLIDSYNKHDGLIQSSVADIIQDENGLIWFYTEQGISAFDGLNFHNYIDSAEFFDSWLIGAHTDTLGNIYFINIAGQVWRWDKNKFERINLPINTVITDINITKENELIVGTDNAGLFLMHNGQWLNLTEREGLYSNSIQSISNANGYTFAATSRGLVKIIKDKPVRVLPYNALNVVKVLINADGNLVLGAVSGLFLFNGRLNKIADNVNMIEDLCIDKFNNIWAATRVGLFRINPHGNAESVLPYSDFRTLLIDRENIVWAGTIGKGVFKIRYNPFQHITAANGFPLRMTFPILEDTNGNIWIGTDHGLIKRTDGRWEVFNELLNKRHINIIEDRDKNIWILTSDEVYKYAANLLSLICNNQNLPGIKNSIKELKDGSILVGTANNGLWKLNNDTIEKLFFSEILDNSSIYTSFIDSQGRIWTGTLGNGLFKIKDDEITQFNSINGFDAAEVYNIDEDDNNNIWAATSNGVYKIDLDNNLKSFTTANGLVSNICYSITAYQNYVFVGTSDGLNLIDGESIQLFTTGDGLLNNDCNTNSFMVDKNNNLWIGSVDGISIINLTDLIAEKTNFECIITRVDSDLQKIDLLTERSIAGVRDFVFEAGDNRITFTCAGLYYSQNSSLSYSYYLIDKNDTTVYLNSNNIFQIDKANPGEYKFYAKAKTPAGVPIRSVNTISFLVKPFFYQTTVFYIIIFTLFMFSIVFYALAKVYNKKKKLEDKYKTSSLTDENYHKVLKKINHAFDEEKIYRDAELTLIKLAGYLAVHKEHISQVINKEHKKNFNDFINSYRVEEAKTILADKNNQRINILSVAHEIGFNSKNTFNSAFKKLTGLTPTEYRNKHMPY